MKNTIIITIGLVLFLASCSLKPRDENILIFSSTEYSLEYFDQIGKTRKNVTKLKTINPTQELKDSSYILTTSYVYIMGAKRKDSRPYTFKVCRTEKNSTDEIKMLIHIPDEESYIYELNNYPAFTFFQYIINSVTAVDTAKKYPSPSEFTAYLDSIQNPNYYVLPAGQECLTINRPIE